MRTTENCNGRDGAFVFAAQMINFTMPGTGSSGHLCGGMLLSAMLGSYAAFLTMIAILRYSVWLSPTADCWRWAVTSGIWRLTAVLLESLLSAPCSRVAASVLGSVLSLQLGAFSVTLETVLSGVTELPCMVFLTFVQPIHLAIGLVECAITAAVLTFVYEARQSICRIIAECGTEYIFPDSASANFAYLSCSCGILRTA